MFSALLQPPPPKKVHHSRGRIQDFRFSSTVQNHQIKGKRNTEISIPDMNNCHFSLKKLRKKKKSQFLRSNTFGVGNVRESRCGQKNVSVWEEKSEGGKRKNTHHAVSIHGSGRGYHVLPAETLGKSVME